VVTRKVQRTFTFRKCPLRVPLYLVCTSCASCCCHFGRSYFHGRCEGIAGIEVIDGIEKVGEIEHWGAQTPLEKSVVARSSRSHSESHFEDRAGEYPVRGSIGGNLLTG